MEWSSKPHIFASAEEAAYNLLLATQQSNFPVTDANYKGFSIVPKEGLSSSGWVVQFTHKTSSWILFLQA